MIGKYSLFTMFPWIFYTASTYSFTNVNRRQNTISFFNFKFRLRWKQVFLGLILETLLICEPSSKGEILCVIDCPTIFGINALLMFIDFLLGAILWGFFLISSNSKLLTSYTFKLFFFQFLHVTELWEFLSYIIMINSTTTTKKKQLL